MKAILTSLIVFVFGYLFSQHPNSFIENKGQILDQNFKVRNDVIAIYSTRKGSFIIRKNGISIQQNTIQYEERESEDKVHGKPHVVSHSTIINRLDLNWENCNLNAQVFFKKPVTAKKNYYLNSRFISDVQSYEEVYLQEIYTNIDLRFYFKNNELEYDFIVKNPKDVDKIQLLIQGGYFSMSKTGELEMNTDWGQIIQSSPVVFQDDKKIKSSWDLRNKHSAVFKLKNVKKYKALVIDPIIRSWATYIGGSELEDLYSSFDVSDMDNEGNLILCGSSSSSDYIVTSGLYSDTLLGGIDGVLTKIDRNGSIIWSTYFGGSNDDYFISLKVNALGEVVCVGNSLSNENLSTDNPVFPFFDITQPKKTFLTTFNTSSGQLLWSKYITHNTSSFQHYLNLTCIDISSTNEICMVLTTNLNGLSTPGSYQEGISNPLRKDYLIIKTSPTGDLLWSTYYGGDDNETRTPNIKFDNENNLVLIGTSYSTSQIATSNSFQENNMGGADGFIVKFDNDGNRLWSTYFGGYNEEYIYGGYVDKSNNIYIFGETLSDSLFIPSGAYQNQNFGNYDGFIGKFSPSGELIWASYYGGTGHEEIFSLVCDSRNNIWFAGFTSSEDLGTEDTHQHQLSGEHDGFIGKLDSLGNLIWFSYYGGTEIDLIKNISLGEKGEIYLVGGTRSQENIASENAFGQVLQGENDYFVAKFIDSDWNLSTTSNFIETKSIIIYPNPSSDILHINTLYNLTDFSVEILDFTGKVIFENKIVNNSIDISSLSNGIYYLLVKNFENEHTFKFIKHN